MPQLSKDKLDRLTRALGHDFKNLSYLHVALTHRSKGSQNYERLEFLGDSILGFVIAQWLYESFPDYGEGRLSRVRASLVRKETLASVARELHLSDYLILGEGELKSGGFNRDSILSDVIESIIGAIYLDDSLQSARDFIYRTFAEKMENIDEAISYKDSKSKLQEMVQKNGQSLPIYNVIDICGEQHEQVFTVDCHLDDVDQVVTAKGSSRRLAEQNAAKKMLSLVNNNDK